MIRNWYKAHFRRFGIRWKWKGKGFIALDGVSLVKQIMSLDFEFVWYVWLPEPTKAVHGEVSVLL